MNRLNTVLAGIDFGGAGADAAAWAATRLSPERVVLGHVVQVPRVPPFLPAGAADGEVLAETLLEGARSRLDALARELSDATGVGFESLVRKGGGVAETLEELASEVEADMIALGPHDRRKGGWNPLGTIPSRVLHETRRPTLIGRSGAGRRPRRVLAAIDDSAVGADVLDWLHWAAGTMDADAIALHVIDFPVRDFRRMIAQADSHADERTEIEAQAADWLRGRLAKAGVDESTEVTTVLGEPEAEILAAARRLDADLLVMGTRGAGAVGRFLLGTVAQAVARKAPCPVLLLPAPR